MRLKLFISLIISCLCFSTFWGQELLFNKLSIKEGLSDNSVRDIIQDSRGYLWFATLNGLDRYDGKNFKNFTAIPGDTTSLRNSRIQKIVEDTRGYIWCITLDGNVSRVDPASNKVLDLYSQILKQETPIRDFALMPSGNLWLWGWKGGVKISYKDEKDDPHAALFDQSQYLPNDTINFITEDKHANVWIGTEGGLVRLAQNGEEPYFISNYLDGVSVRSFYETAEGLWFGTFQNGLTNFSFEKNAFQALPQGLSSALQGQAALRIQPITDQRLLIGSSRAVFDLDLQTNSLQKHSHGTLETVEKIYVDAHNNYWIAAQSRGIYRFDIKARQLEYYDLNAVTRSFLGDLDKQILFEDSHQNFWVGIYGGGLFLYQNDKNEFQQYTYAESQNAGLSSNQVLSLFEDNSKNLWIGTMYGGINKVNLSNSGFFWHQPVNQPQNAFDNEIRAATTDRMGNLWLGSKGGKIFCYNSKYQKIKTLPDDLSQKNRVMLNNISVYCLYFDGEDNLWIGTKGKGIFVLKDVLDTTITKPQLLHFHKSHQIQNSNALDEVYSIKEDQFGQFWIGSHFSGLTSISNPFTNPVFSVFTKESTHGQLVSNFIRYLFLDASGNLWIGTSHGISILQNQQLRLPQKQFLSIINNKRQESSLSYNSVDHIFQASDQTIYVATMGGGLNKLEFADWEKAHFEWKYYNKSAGLTTNKVYAIEEDLRHNLWISTSQGLNKFDPATEAFEHFFVEKDNGLNYFTESCITKTADAELILGHCRGFLQFNPQDILKDTTSYPIVLSRIFINGVDVNPKGSDLLKQSIEFEKSIQLNHLQNSIQLDFSVLDFRHPEKIQFSYKLENLDEDWSTPLTTNSALFQNLPPGHYTFRLKATNSDGVEVKDELQFKIFIAPPFFKTPIGYALLGLLGFLIIRFLLFQYNRQIKAQHQIAYTEKIHEKKLKYYTNISHEFKTPLTMILNPVDDIIQSEAATPEIIANANHIQKNARYLLDLVEQILDFRKIREEKMPLSVSYIDIAAFIKNVFYIFKPLADKSDIDFLLFMPQQKIMGYLDRRIIEKILYNLLSNAFKHTPANKRIELIINVSQQNGFLELQVKDEGEGIEKKALIRLFERFYRSENSSGLGLFFVKELVLHHKGRIEVDSEFQRGTCFKVFLPIQKSQYTDAEIASEAPSMDLSPLPSISSAHLQNKTLHTQDKRDSILLIDDNEEIRTYIANKLKADFQVFLAANGQEGIQVALEKIPDIIISDVMMPVLDGIEMTQQLRKNFNTSHIPIILLTANSSDEKKFEGIEWGADDYITKPFDFKYLKLKIDSLVQQRKQLLTRFNQDPSLSADTLTRSQQDKEFIEKVTSLIDEYMGESEFSVELLSEKLNCSRTNFYKKMKGITGETPHEFIRTMQMKKAALLLRETNHSIADVGYMIGFNDANYFSKSFKKHFGKTPKNYQRQQGVLGGS